MDYIKIEKYKEWLKNNLDKERYEHSLGVAECAEELAKQFGINSSKAYIAGLVHDCAKCVPTETLKNKLTTLTNLCEGELINPKTYHAPYGAILAKELFKIDDEEILSSIRWHTIGKIDMTLFEKIIFIADKIEKRTRPVEWAEPIRQCVRNGNLDKALLVCYKNTITSLIERNLKICKMTVDIYNNLLDKTENI